MVIACTVPDLADGDLVPGAERLTQDQQQPGQQVLQDVLEREAGRHGEEAETGEHVHRLDRGEDHHDRDDDRQRESTHPAACSSPSRSSASGGRTGGVAGPNGQHARAGSRPRRCRSRATPAGGPRPRSRTGQRPWVPWPHRSREPRSGRAPSSRALRAPGSPSPNARSGWPDSVGQPLSCVGVTGFEPAASSSRTTRATKLRHTPWHVAEARGPQRHPRIADRVGAPEIGPPGPLRARGRRG